MEGTLIINGEPVRGTVPGCRVNIFPPALEDGMVVGDLGGDPEGVSRAMQGLFTEPENIRRLKGAIDRRIQLRESSTKELKRTRSGPRKIVPTF